MSKFTDRQGDVWVVKIDLPLARELARATPYDILNPDSYQDLMTSFGARLELLWYLVRPQAEDHGVADFRQFEERLHGGDGIVFQASDAFCEACISFFQRLGLTPMVTIAETYLEMGRKLLEQVQTEAFQEELAKDRKRFERTLGISGGTRDSTQTKERRRKKKDERKRRRTGRAS